MKRGGGGGRIGELSRQRSIQILIAVALIYLFLFTLEIPFVFTATTTTRSNQLPTLSNRHYHAAAANQSTQPQQQIRQSDAVVSAILLDDHALDYSDGYSELHELATHARQQGSKIWKELESGNLRNLIEKPENVSGLCPKSVSVTGSEFSVRGNVMVIPCGLTLGSHVTVVGKPTKADVASELSVSWGRKKESGKEVSHFVMELIGLRAVDGEEPPKILHFNPRLKGDWSGKPVLELNTCYRMHWGTSLRCDGWKSRADEDTGENFSLLADVRINYGVTT